MKKNEYNVNWTCPRCGAGKDERCLCYTTWSGGKREELIRDMERDEESRMDCPDYPVHQQLFLGEENNRRQFWGGHKKGNTQ